MEKGETTKNFLQSWKAGIKMPMYDVIILPLAEEDIVNNTDYIAFEKCYYKNYKIFFYIDKEKTTVYVLRVLHMLVNAKPLLLKMRF